MGGKGSPAWEHFMPNPYILNCSQLNTDMISNLSYYCMPAVLQEKPSFIFKGNLNPPQSRARHFT